MDDAVLCRSSLAPPAFSPYGRASTCPSPVNRMMAGFARDFRDAIDINLGVGYVNEKTIPIALLRRAMDAVIADPVRYRQAFNYGGPEGSANLIGAIGRFLARSGRLDEQTLARKRLVIGPCGATSILDALAEIFAPGIVVTSDPVYYVYANALERKGFELLAVPEDDEGIELEALHRRLAALGERLRRIAFFYVVTVNNPSCTILSEARRRELVELVSSLAARLGRRIPIFFDLAYELLIHDPDVGPRVSALREDPLDLVYEIGTLSKVLAPALRIGYLHGPPGLLMDAMVQKTSDTGFSAPLFAQEMAAYLLDGHIGEQLERVQAGYRDKAVAVRRAIEAALGPYLESCRGGRAGFYFYLSFSRVETHTGSPFFRYLSRTTGDPAIDGPPEEVAPRVVYLPGEYCVHQRGELVEAGRRQLRLSYGFEDTPAIVRAIGLMAEAARFALAHQAPEQAPVHSR
jgi:2-aminoadipate transaminase